MSSNFCRKAEIKKKRESSSVRSAPWRLLLALRCLLPRPVNVTARRVD